MRPPQRLGFGTDPGRCGRLKPGRAPAVTGVGGTLLSVTTSGAYAGETTWFYPVLDNGTSGGQSYTIAQPSWQVGSGLADTLEQGPQAGPRRGRRRRPQLGQRRPHGRSWGTGGGTSLSSPIWAGFTALIDQYLHQHGKAPVGFFNRCFITWRATPRYPPFHPCHQAATKSGATAPATTRAPAWGAPTCTTSPVTSSPTKGPTSHVRPNPERLHRRADLPPLPTQTCPHCSNITPIGNYCGVCGAHPVHPQASLATRRPHAFSANPEESVLRLSVVSTLFPHLSHRSSVPFRAGFAAVGRAADHLLRHGPGGPGHRPRRHGRPLLFQLYIYEVDVYEDDHLLLAAETLLIGAGLGVGWALLGGPVVSHALQPTLGSSLGGGDVVKAAVLVPIVGQALMLVPLLLVLVLVPGFGSRRESLDGFTLGAASALGFSFAGRDHRPRASRLSAGLGTQSPLHQHPHRGPHQGHCHPRAGGGSDGTGRRRRFGSARPREGTVAGRRALAHQPVARAGGRAGVQVGLGFADQARLADIPLLCRAPGGTAVVLLALRVGLHHILLHEQHDVAIGPGTTCSHCNHIVPFMPFCPSAGWRRWRLQSATGPGRGGRGSRGAGDRRRGGWPTLARAPRRRPDLERLPHWPRPTHRVSSRAHHTLLLGMFGAGLTAISVALVLTAVTQEPNTKPVPRCHLGGCPGLARARTSGAAGAPWTSSEAGRPEPPPYGTWKSTDGRFSIGLFIPGCSAGPR